MLHSKGVGWSESQIQKVCCWHKEMRRVRTKTTLNFVEMELDRIKPKLSLNAVNRVPFFDHIKIQFGGNLGRILEAIVKALGKKEE